MFLNVKSNSKLWITTRAHHNVSLRSCKNLSLETKKLLMSHCFSDVKCPNPQRHIGEHMWRKVGCIDAEKSWQCRQRQHLWVPCIENTVEGWCIGAAHDPFGYYNMSIQPSHTIHPYLILSHLHYGFWKK
jgi:hypothetical protein